MLAKLRTLGVGQTPGNWGDYTGGTPATTRAVANA